MERLGDLTQRVETHQRATARVAWALASDSFIADDVRAAMRQRGFGRFVKSGDVLSSEDPGVALGPLSAGFLGSVDQQSLLGQLDGVLVLPIGAAVRLQLGDVAATVTGEAEEKLVATIGFDVAGPPSKLVAQIIVSSETLRALDQATQTAITNVLVSAVAKATDVALVSTLTAGSPASSADPATLLAACSGGQPRRPYLIGGFDALLALPAGTIRDLTALGIGIVPCTAAAGELIALDASGLLVSQGDLVIETARHATMDLAVSGSPTVRANLWQRDLVALRCERFIRFSVRAGAVAYASTGSPS